MEENYRNICKYIKECYENNSFDAQFEFYKTRKEKGANRAGIFNDNGKKYFFKIIEKEEYNDESNILSMIEPYHLSIVPKYAEYEFGTKVINLYEYVETTKINSFNYLRRKKVPLEEKKEAMESFFQNVTKLMEDTIVEKTMSNDAKSDRWFYGRVKKGGRVTKFYGEDFDKLKKDIQQIKPELYPYYEHFFGHIYEYFEDESKTLFAYTHGDYHDFNFSLNGLFWDIDTFGINPILNDFVVYYWHFYAREDCLIYQYSPWLVFTMYNELSKEELKEIRKLKEKIIQDWFSKIEEQFEKHHLKEQIYKEFVSKLFCRVFLIDNLFLYEESTRKKIYEFYAHFLKDEKEIGKLLFSNPIVFTFEGK